MSIPSFTRLSPSVHLHTPTSPCGAPTILICSWIYASARHITKYTSAYTAQFPTSRILLVTCAITDFFRSPRSLSPAVDALLSFGEAEELELLVHSFSNGGAHQFLQVARLFRERTGRKLPVRALVLDSAPGSAGLAGLVSGFQTLPWWRRRVLTAVLWLLGLVTKILGVRNPIERIRMGLNSGVNFAEARRVYIYGSGDAVVRREDVEAHAKDAEERGWRVRRVVFDGTAHVAHVRGDQKKYWEVVKSTWTGEGSAGHSATGTGIIASPRERGQDRGDSQIPVGIPRGRL